MILVVAAFADIVAGTFAGFTAGADGDMVKNAANGSVAMASMLFIPLAVGFGFLNRKNVNLGVTTIVGVLLLALCIFVGLKCPVYFSKTAWLVVIDLYLHIYCFCCSCVDFASAA